MVPNGAVIRGVDGVQAMVVVVEVGGFVFGGVEVGGNVVGVGVVVGGQCQDTTGLSSAFKPALNAAHSITPSNRIESL